jgi:polysaccharide biosynthesis/export protein
MQIFTLWMAAVICITGSSSCLNARKALYFANIKDSTLRSSNTAPDYYLQSNDLLGISITSANPQASVIYNMPEASASSVTSSTGTVSNGAGYLINKEGNIQLPGLGNIKAVGLTKDQLNAVITGQLNDKKLLIDPVVTIRYLNFKVTVLGEVARPTVISVPSERISLLEAIGLAGDLTIYARRDNVFLIREENGKKITRRLNLNSGQLFTSPYYYLKSNDVVYVEPGKSKVESAGRAQQWLPILLSGLSIAVILADRLTR